MLLIVLLEWGLVHAVHRIAAAIVHELRLSVALILNLHVVGLVHQTRLQIWR